MKAIRRRVNAALGPHWWLVVRHTQNQDDYIVCSHRSRLMASLCASLQKKSPFWWNEVTCRVCSDECDRSMSPSDKEVR